MAEDEPKVLRIFRAVVKPGREDEWEKLLQEQLQAERISGRDGLLRWYRGRPLDGEEHVHVVVTIWRSKDAVRAFAGASGHAVLYRNQAELADEITVEQFEIRD